jgi:hypothetical protein
MEILTDKEICLINRVLTGIEESGDVYEGFFIDEPAEYKKYEKLRKRMKKIADEVED